MLSYLKHWPIPSDLSSFAQVPPPPQGKDLLEWFLWGFLVIVSALGVTIAFLYKSMENRNKTAIDDMKLQYSQMIGELEEQLNTMQGHIDLCNKERLELYAQSRVQQSKIDKLEEEIFSLRKT